MWRIIKLFFRRKAKPELFPETVQSMARKVCETEVYPWNYIVFRRKSLNYFAMEFCHSETGWGFYFDSLELD